MLCLRCSKEIPEDSAFCCYCGKNQAPYSNKRGNGLGTITIDKRYRNRYIVRAPAGRDKKGRIYIGSYQNMEQAQKVLSDYIKRGCPQLYNATVSDIYNAWSRVHYKNIKKRTADSYRSVWKHFQPIENMKMSDVRTVHFQNIVNSHQGNGVSAEIKMIARALCRFAMENDITDKNYGEFIKLAKTEKTEKTVFSEKQISELWKHSSDKNVQAILVMIYMGFRIGETAALTIENVDLEKGYIIGGVKTKSGKNRIVPFPKKIPEIRGFIEEWIKTAGADGRLFPITEHTFRISVFYSTLIKLGMIDAYIDKKHRVIFHTADHLTPHSTRHTFASLSAAAGMQPERLQRIMGHASFKTTADYYIHTNSDELTAEMEKLRKPVKIYSFGE